MSAHELMLEDVAVYVLGALPEAEAAAVRSHLQTCDECRREYVTLRPAADALGFSAEACADPSSGAIVPSRRLKARIIQQVRRDSSQRLSTNIGELRAVRPIVWPAYAVAAACLALALITVIFNMSLNEENRQFETQLSQLNAHASVLTRELVVQRTELADLVSPESQRYPVTNGEVIKHRTRLYIAMEQMPPPPKGKVYQAWTLHARAAKMVPSVTFVPNRSGVAVVPIPVNAASVVAVAVSLEPEGGSKQPTSAPAFVVKLTQ